MTAKIQIRRPESRTVAMSSLCLGDFFSFPANDERVYVVIEIMVDDMQYREIGTDNTYTNSGLSTSINKLRLTAAFFEVRP